MIYVYEFADGSTYRLVDIGFSLNDIWALEKLHGKLITHGIMR